MGSASRGSCCSMRTLPRKICQAGMASSRAYWRAAAWLASLSAIPHDAPVYCIRPAQDQAMGTWELEGRVGTVLAWSGLLFRWRPLRNLEETIEGDHGGARKSLDVSSKGGRPMM